MALNYHMEDLYWQDFEKMVVAVCRNILGRAVRVFAPGPDGGRDAVFEGTAVDFPSKANPWQGKFVIQAKHTTRADASCNEGAFFANQKSSIKDEIPKIKKLVDSNECDCYLLFTNRSCPAQTELDIINEIKSETGVANAMLIAKETLTEYLDSFPEIPRRFRLGQIVKAGHNLPKEMLGNLFIGRWHDLKVLAEQLEKDTVTLTQTVLGTGGIGKTRLALEYARRSTRRYRFFVNAASPSSLQTDISNLVEWLDLPVLENQEAQFKSVIQKLQNLPDWLLILDNVDDLEAQEAVQEITPFCRTMARY